MNFTEQIMNHPAYSATDIVKKCKKYPEFYQELIKIQKEYCYDLNMAIYADLQDIQYMQVFRLDKKQNLYVSFFGYLMPPTLQLGFKFYMFLIRMLDEVLRNNIGKKYTIIYYHSLCQSDIPYNFLANVFRKLPLYYYAMLDKIYTVESTYFLRKGAGLFDFGRLYKLYDRKLENIQKLSQFANKSQIINNGLLQNLPQKLMIELQEKTKKKLMKNGNLMAYHQSLPVYSVFVPKKDHLMVELSSYKVDKEGIPLPLSILLHTLRKNTKFLQLQGIFRKSGSIQNEEQIIDQLAKMDEDQQFQNLQEYSGYCIAGVVKKFFTKLIIPIVPFQTYDHIMKIISNSPIKQEEELDFMFDFLGQLPYLNKKVLLHLIAFLRDDVIIRQQKNKMNSYNMSVCFFPCIFKSKTISEIDLINSGKFVKILKILFTRFDEIVKEVDLNPHFNKQTMQTAEGNQTLKDFRMSLI